MNEQSTPQNHHRHSFGRILRWVLAVILALLTVAVVALELVSWNFLKAPITDRVEAATGRELEIRGDVSVGLLPRPHLVLENLAFENADWAQADEMATVRRLEVVPSLISLIRGEPVIKDLEISEPTINLQARDQAPGNWVLPAIQSSENQGETASEQTSGSAGKNDPPPVVIEEVSVTNGRVRYLVPDSEEPYALSLSTLTVSEDSIFAQGEVSSVSGEQRTALPFALEAGVRPGFSDGQWQLTNLEAHLGDTQVSGNMGFDNSTPTPVISANLHSPSVHVPDILAQLPESPQSAEPREFAVPVLPALAGDLQLTADEVILQAATLDNVEVHIKPGEHELILEKLRFGVAKGEIGATGRLTSTETHLSAEAHGQLQGLDLHALGMSDEPGHIVAAELALGLERMDQAQTLDVQRLLNHTEIRVAKGSYQTTGQRPGDHSDLDFTLDEAGEPPAPVLSINGQFQGKPLELDIEGAPKEELVNDLADYRLLAQARSDQLLAWADTRLGALLSPATFAGNLVLDGDDARNLEQWIGPVLPPLPEFRVAGRLSRDENRWSATGLEGTIGATDLTGEVHYTHGDQPAVNVDLDAGRIELAQFLDGGAGNGTSSDNGSGSDAGSSPLSALRAFDGKLDLTVATLALPDGLELEQFQATAMLETGNLTIERLRFDVADGTWTSSANFDATSQPASGTINAAFDDIALSRFGDTFTEVEDRLGRFSGDLSLDITGALPADRREDLILPFIGRLDFQPSKLRFRSTEADTEITLKLETGGLDAGNQTFLIDGEGQYDGAPFSLRFRGDPLLDARDPDRPYALDLSGNIVNTRVRVQGTILQPLSLKGLDLGLELEGPTPQRLSRLLGTPLPDLPGYSASGQLSLQDQRWIFSDITGRAGDSDLSGRIVFDTSDLPPHIEAELSSSMLDIKDLRGLVGAATAEPADEEEPVAAPEDGNVLPDEPLITPAWRNLSANVQYRAGSVRAADVPLSDVVIDFTLEDGQAQFDPVRFGVGNGRVDFNLNLDSRPEVPQGTLQLEVQGVNLRQALQNWALADESIGTVGAQGKFWLTGDSLAGLLASADGGLVLLMTRGRLDALLVELAGLDASQSFLSWLSDRDPIPIDCTYADLQARGGVVRIDTLAIDTTDTTFTGNGTVDMNTEQLDVTITAHPKDVSVLSARTPFHLGGTFDDIQPGLNEAGLATRLGGSAALAAVAGPVAALIPLLDLGTGDDVPYCEGLAKRSRKAIKEHEGADEGAPQ